MTSVENKIWFCGFYEGEGSVSNDKSNNNRIKLCISQNDKTPLELGQSIWGGSIRERVRRSKNKLCHGHEWVLNHNQALAFIEDIKPYMKIPYKINQLQDVLNKHKKGWFGVYECSFCDLVYSNAQGRRRHEKMKHINKNVLHKCPTCGNEYEYKDSLKRHMKTHV